MTNKQLENIGIKANYVEILPDVSIKEALRLFREDGQGIIFVCERNRQLLGILTDGDFRKALARSLDIDAPCEKIMNRTPIVAQGNISVSEARKKMDGGRAGSIFYLPIVDSQNRIINVLSRESLISEDKLPIKAVIMAGGFGSRLGELTRYVPKPMLKIGQDKSLLEHIINQMVSYGINDIVISTHHLAEKIHDFFGDGKAFNANISYVHEESPLGTAGALSLLEDKSKPLLVMNGDILTTVNFEAMWRYHYESEASLTIACRQYDMPIPYGVVKTDENGDVIEIQEKPHHRFQINGGIYLVEPEIVQTIPKNTFKNMTDIITEYCENEQKVNSFIMHEYWLDVGVPKDYKQAQEDYKKVFE